jgi:hypothetical protein
MGDVLEASAETDLLKTWPSKCQLPRDTRPEKSDIRVWPSVMYMAQVGIVVTKRQAYILFVNCFLDMHILHRNF